MKHTLFIFALLTASIQTFAQSPRIKLNQITKDSISGSVLISSPTDSGMVYSRDLFISYGADTVLILNGDTLAATSGIISSVLSDGVTITGNGTTGSELTVDTNTVIATKQDLDLYYLDSNPDGYTSNTGTVTSVGGTGTVNGISLSGTVTSSGNLTLGGTLSNVNLASQVTGTLPIANGGTGATTLSGAGIVTGSGANNYLPKFTGSTTVGNSAITDDGYVFTVQSRSVIINAATNAYSEFLFKENGVLKWNTYNDFNTDNYVIGNSSGPKFFLTQSGLVGIGASSPSYPLEMGSGAHVTTGGVWTDASDIKLKTNINYIYPYGLEDIMNLKPTMFDYKNGEKNSLGFIAQDIYEIIPEAISSTIDYNGNETMGLKMVSITATLVKAIQEQQSIIESQAIEIEQLKTQIQLILNEIEQLKNN